MYSTERYCYSDMLTGFTVFSFVVITTEGVSGEMWIGARNQCVKAV